MTSGVPQGFILGHFFFFILFINHLPDTLTSSQIALYTDNSKLFKVVKSQADLHHVFLWSVKWKMLFNIDKCRTMSTSCKKSMDDAIYYMGGTAFKNVRLVKDLRITICNNLNWCQSISNITSKANRLLRQIKQTCKDLKDADTRRTLYCSLVLPQLEFSSQLWSPSQINQKLLENVCQATKISLNDLEDMSYK